MESLEQKYAQTLENSNLSLKQRQVLLSSLKLFSEIGFENTTASLIAKEAGFQGLSEHSNNLDSNVK